MRKVRIDSILTEEQIKDVANIVNTNENRDNLLSELKRYFLEIKDDLESKGVYHEYLAWVVYAKANNNLEA